MKLFELFLTEYQIQDLSRGKMYRGYINSQTGKILNLGDEELLHPHVHLVIKHQDQMDIDDHYRSLVPPERSLESPRYVDFINRHDRFAGDYQHAAYRRNWVRFDVRGGNKVDFNFSGYGQDVADVLSTPFVVSGLKIALRQQKVVLFNLDVITPGKSGYKGFSDECYSMTDFNEMKRRFAATHDVKLIESLRKYNERLSIKKKSTRSS